jgi:hypothetical protein
VSELYRVPLTSTACGHSSWLQIQRPGFDSRCYHIFWEVVGLERGPLSLVSTTEELHGRNSSGSGLEIREYGSGDPLRWPRDTLYQHKLALTSPTSGGRYSSLRPRSLFWEASFSFYLTITRPCLNTLHEYNTVFCALPYEHTNPGQTEFCMLIHDQNVFRWLRLFCIETLYNWPEFLRIIGKLLPKYILERLLSFGMCRHVGIVRTDVSEERFASIFRIDQFASQLLTLFLSRGFLYPEDWGDMFPRNVGSHKTQTEPHPRILHSQCCENLKSYIPIYLHSHRCWGPQIRQPINSTYDW